ncbi:hypothetical protein BJY52DRAFT_1232412 [Lactarius psammicola]|nr:hypothetical protein BJY52DRAFT_1232412 [Lactarius psammicola]
MACLALHPLGAGPPVAGFSDIEVGTDSSEDLDLELASFCQKFDLEPQVQGFESDTDGDNTPGSDANHDPSNEPEIAEQSELEHFSAVLQRAQQIAIWLEKEEVRNTQESKTRAMEQAT